MDEQIIRKEDGLLLGGSFFSFPKKGALVLAGDRLSFLQRRTNAKLFDISLRDILNVRALFLSGSGDGLLLMYRDGSAEKKLKIRHKQYLVMGQAARIREPYFKSWETLLDDKRLGRENH